MTMLCIYCNGRVDSTDRKCPSCGSTAFIPLEPARPQPEAAPQPEYPPQVQYQTMHHTIYVHDQPSQRNRWLALALCLVGGFLGVHRFYTGKVGTGVLYILTGGLFGVGAFVDFCSILFGVFRDGEGRKLST